MPAFYVVIPVLNEVANLERLVAAFRDLERDFGSRYSLRFLLIDDGTTDGTPAEAAKLAQGMDLHTLVHDCNSGPGRAYATAFACLATRPHDDMVFTNVVNPRSHVTRRDEYRPTLAKKGASARAASTPNFSVDGRGRCGACGQTYVKLSDRVAPEEDK